MNRCTAIVRDASAEETKPAGMWGGGVSCQRANSCTVSDDFPCYSFGKGHKYEVTGPLKTTLHTKGNLMLWTMYLNENERYLIDIHRVDPECN